MLGLLYENTLQDFIKELNIDLVKKIDTEELVMMGASSIAKTVGRKALGVRQGSFPATKRVPRVTPNFQKHFKP